MKIDDIINIAFEVSSNDGIIKDGLSLRYALNPEQHRRLNEEIFYQVNGANTNPDAFEDSDEFDVIISDIKFIFVKK